LLVLSLIKQTGIRQRWIDIHNSAVTGQLWQTDLLLNLRPNYLHLRNYGLAKYRRTWLVRRLLDSGQIGWREDPFVRSLGIRAVRLIASKSCSADLQAPQQVPRYLWRKLEVEWEHGQWTSWRSAADIQQLPVSSQDVASALEEADANMLLILDLDTDAIDVEGDSAFAVAWKERVNGIFLCN
jgi:hypothetical protein